MAITKEEQLSILRAIGFGYNRHLEDEADMIWKNLISGWVELPQVGDIIDHRYIDSTFPEEIEGLGKVFILGKFLENWRVVRHSEPPKPYLSFAICMVDDRPDSVYESLRITEVISDGKVRGEFFKN